MNERPQLTAAKVSKLAAIIADADRLKSMSKSERPASATIEQVRTEYANAVSELDSNHGSVAEVHAIRTPTERIGDNA